MKFAQKNMQSRRNPNAVLDSVIVVSAFLTGGMAADLIQECKDKTNLYTATEIFGEIRRVLLEKDHIQRRYTYADDDVDIFMTELQEHSTIVKSLPEIQAVERDSKDDMTVACTVAANADYIVSRDLLDLVEYKGIRIVSPKAFVEILRE